MALTEVMTMPLADLQWVVTQNAGTLDSTGSSSGSACPSTSVHCCLKLPPTVEVMTATPSESPSGYKLVMAGQEFAIGIEPV